MTFKMSAHHIRNLLYNLFYLQIA